MTAVPFLDLAAMHAEVRSELDECWQQLNETSRFVGGGEVDAFEAEWAAYCERRHCIGTANGTDAIELALKALGIGAGDEVVVPTNTFIATCEAVTAVGATPVFADVEPASLLMSAETVAPVLTSATAAIVVVHLFGHPVDMDGIMALAESRGLVVVEDAAQAHGATWKGRKMGSFGAASAFSFYPGKNLGAFGDGGAVVTDDADLAERIRTLGNHGRAPSSHTEHILDGCNSRLDSLQAAILRIKLRKLDEWNTGRREASELYRKHLPDSLWMLPAREGAVASHHLEITRVANRDAVREALGADGVGTGIHYPVPCHLQPPFARFTRQPMPIAEAAAGEIMSLPMFPHLNEDQISIVCDRLGAVLDGNSTTS